MPRVTKSLTAKANIKKFLNLLRVTMVLEVDYFELLNNQVLNLFNMHLETGRIKKELLEIFGLQE